MLEGLVAWILNNYLGKYVENLNTDQLSIALLSGEVELEKLPIRKDALRILGLPLQVRAGYIGRVRLQIPVRQFRSAPWVILIEQLNIVAGPVNLDKWDAEFERATALEFKLSKLDSHESKWRALRDSAGKQGQTPGYYASSYSSWLSYGASFVTGIVDNLQFKIRDVHIRYEDDISIPGQVFACGLTLGSLTTQGPPNGGSATNNGSTKTMELQALSIYWDSIEESDMLGALSLSELAAALNKIEAHQYILHPVKGRAQLIRDYDESSVKPKLVCDLQLNLVPLSLIDWQYDQLIKCTQGLDNIARIRDNRQNRPSVTVVEDRKAWWLYALRCHGHDFFARPTLDESLAKARDNVRYVELYTRLLTVPSAAIPPEQKLLKERMETELNFEQLKALREVAMNRVPKPTKTSEDNTTGQNGGGKGYGVLFQWFPQYWGWYSGGGANKGGQSSQLAITNGEMETATAAAVTLESELLDAIASVKEENKHGNVLGEINFTLEEGTFSICMGESYQKSVPMLELHFESVKVSVEARSRTGSYQTKLALGSVSILDKITRNSIFPVLISPQGKDNAPLPRMRHPISNQRTRSSVSCSQQVQTASSSVNEPLFSLCFERKPLGQNADYSLSIKSQALDIVYNVSAVHWLIDFICKPHQMASTRRKINDMKLRTKQELIKNWEHLLEGDLSERKVWSLELDISAPQIIFVENFLDCDTNLVVLDFGRLVLSNKCQSDDLGDVKMGSNQFLHHRGDSEDEELFMTPCSTPPGSEASGSDSPTLCSASGDVGNGRNQQETSFMGSLNQDSLHNRIYDKYNVEFSDLQVLVGRANDNWSFAHSKGTSNLHVLDRFNISLTIERRLVYTVDPQYPSLIVSGTLPRLVVHLAEQKIFSLKHLLDVLDSKRTDSPFKSPTGNVDNIAMSSESILEPAHVSDHTKDSASKIITLQFSVEQLAIEVQSRGKGVAELQVTGVRLGFTKCPTETSATLLVHGLLLVDALQTFGPDFELLVASHKHVGMDSVSGSLRDSDPCSPTSPASPDPMNFARRSTSPHQISQALNSLRQGHVSPILESSIIHKDDDSEALIVIEVLYVHANEQEEALQIASIQFNNLDIIANQETIVELIGFANRVMPKFHTAKTMDTLKTTTYEEQESKNLYEMDTLTTRTEITFDFHRLNVLVLRALMRDGCYIGRKVATATMSEARIHATIGSVVSIEGSLGGLQVLDLTPTGITHQRVLSVGKDPLTDPETTPHVDLLQILTTEIYNSHPYNAQQSQMSSEMKCNEALSFCVVRKRYETTNFEIKLRMGSVWYTYSPHLLIEIKMCVTEFQTYLSQLAKNIKARAAGMAMGLVQARMDSISHETYNPNRTTAQNDTSPSPTKYFQQNNITIKLDVVLDTPVLVLPRAATSPHVFVAHLGRISLTNSANSTNEVVPRRINNAAFDTYIIEIKDMNLYSLDTSTRRSANMLDSNCSVLKAEHLYSSKGGLPILHDTTIRLEIAREILDVVDLSESADQGLGDDKSADRDCVQIGGCVITPLRVSLSRDQYEQLLDTVDNITSSPKDFQSARVNINSNVDTEQSTINDYANTGKNMLDVKMKFEVPCLTLELRADCGTGQQGLVEISLRDFLLNYEKCHDYETNVLVSLRTLIMEDLLKEPDSKYRYMVVSSAEFAKQSWYTGGFVSRSCPNLVRISSSNVESPRGSLPDHLETGIGFNINQNRSICQSACPVTPPSSPTPSRRMKDHQENHAQSDTLVQISALFVDPEAPDFDTKYKSLYKTVSVDFNSLDMVVAVQSWLVVLDFFGMSGGEKLDNTDVVDAKDEVVFAVASSTNTNTAAVDTRKSEIEIFVRSLNMIMMRQDEDLAKVAISNVSFSINRDENLKIITGTLGSLSLLDLTSHGQIYRERFATAGQEEALNFTYTTNVGTMRRKHSGNSTDLPVHIDTNLKVRMSSVRYVHTKRFVTEIQYFFKHLSLLQTIMEKLRHKTKDKLSEWNRDPSRLLLDIRAKSPVILFPVSTRSEYFLVADAGELVVTNKFMYAGHKDTISVQRDPLGPIELLDVMSLDLVDTDLFTGIRDNTTCPHHKGYYPNNKDTKNNAVTDTNANAVPMDLVGFKILRLSPSLLTDKCHLQIQIERNLNYACSHNVSDLTIQCTLSKLDAALDLDQYRLIRGMLKHNLGESLDDIVIPVNMEDLMDDVIMATGQDSYQTIWTVNCLRILLHNVSVDLSLKAGKPLACINFIKSRLTVETYSDNTQDIDLVSQEVLVADTRYRDEPVNKRCNVFSNVLQPVHFRQGEDDSHQVQAEVHSRIRRNNSKFTILLNNMRLMAIFDWLEIARDYLMQCQDPPGADDTPAASGGGAGHQASGDISPQHLQQHQRQTAALDASIKDNKYSFELKLNITDSELVVIENASQWDTNAVILKSTSVISFKPDTPRPLSLNLNQLELFSCILGMEDDSALSIIDPVTVQLDLNQEGVLEAQLHTLCVRLSYHDVRMFQQILKSLPKQFLSGGKGHENIASNAIGANKSKPSPPANTKSHVSKLQALGFSKHDCLHALEHCDYQLDEAALWLTKTSEPYGEKYSTRQQTEDMTDGSYISGQNANFEINVLEVKANCMSLCIIDDCRDSDVPLLELSLSQVFFHHDLRALSKHEITASPQDGVISLPKPILPPAVGATTSTSYSQDLILSDGNTKTSEPFDSQLLAILAGDYYNRALSGWEPFIEPWKCDVKLKFGRASNHALNNELHVRVLSSDMLNVNITSTLIDLISMVHKNWMQDIYSSVGDSGGGMIDAGQSSGAGTPPGFKRRYPFVPFALKNETGNKLWFCTLITTPDSNSTKQQPDLADPNWQPTSPDQITPFSFAASPSTVGSGGSSTTSTRKRHQDTHKLSLHQVFVRVEGWSIVGPVSVDKVGVYFRHANAEAHPMNIEFPRARIVFSVSLEGSAQKLVTVRSALRLVNRIGTPIQLRMEYLNGQFGILKWPPARETVVAPGTCYSIPLSHAHSHLKLRPILESVTSRKQDTTMVHSTQNWLRNQQRQNNQRIEENTDSSSKFAVGGAKLDATAREAIKVLGSRSLGASLTKQCSDFQYCRQSLMWWQVQRSGDVVQELRTCFEKDRPYRFVACIRRENYPVNQGHLGASGSSGARVQPAHTITVLPTVQLLNHLPYDLLYKCAGCAQSGRIGPNGQASLTEIDLEKSTEISITLDNFPSPGVIQMPTGITGNVTQRLRMLDASKRPLHLEATISVSKGAGLQVSVWCPYWLLNRTGLPILFRQAGTGQDAAGQGSEHEAARMVAPLLFSFADVEASPALEMRRGRYYDGGVPQWCPPLHLQSGVQVRQLVTSMREGRPDSVALVGVEVRQGRGANLTTVVTVTPRYQIYNRSAHRLQFSQKCFATTVSDPGAQATHQESTTGCHQPFHWPRLDKEQLLCIRILDVEGCLWSSGIRIDKNYSQHINIRDCSGGMHFLRMEVLLQGATFFVVIGDAQELPPPIRIDNYSQVPITFYQSCCKDQFHSVARPGTAIAYALDVSCGPALICLGAPGGVTGAYDIYELGPAKGLTYENFIYIAFSGTFKNNHDILPAAPPASTAPSSTSMNGLDVDDQRLVLGVVNSCPDRVVLMPKQHGNRGQLWRMTSTGQLQHEGSSPPRDPGAGAGGDKRSANDKILVLDIEGPAPQPSQYVKLVLRRPDPRRRSTQTWKFTEDGRLTCAHNSMCVQAKDGFFGLRTGSNGQAGQVANWQPWSEAVLGLPQLISHRFTDSGVPLEQAVSRQRLRPGSGFLSVIVTTDGPTRVLQIHDIKIPGSYPLPCDWRSSNVTSTIAEATANSTTSLASISNSNKNRELKLSVALEGGLGLSLISRIPAEELMYVSLAGIAIQVHLSRAARNLDLKVSDVQIDNQLLDAPGTVLLHSRLNRSDSASEWQAMPVIHITAEVLPSPNLNAVIFKHLIIQLRPLSVFLEERLLLRFADFIGLGAPADMPCNITDADFEGQKIATQVTASNAKRYYFGILQIIPGQIRLSMMTSNKLPPHLQQIKRHLGLTLIKFEDAAIELEAFSRRHPFETSQSLVQSIVKHYKDELKWQAANILGSVDFLGNPLGFVNDVSEGVSGLFSEGNVAALVKNVTHGLSNSAAKVTESLSDGLGRVIMDEQHEETRQRIRSGPTGGGSSGSHHLLAGLKGLGFGLLGGVTSIVKQTYEGAANEGVQGLFSGLGKGLVGTVTKPIVGVLDLASETATAVRDSSRSSSRILPERRRLPRCVTSGLGGLLPPYSQRHALGQQYMYQLNGYDYTGEIFMGYELIRTGHEDLRVLISSEWIRVFTKTPERTNVVLEVHLSDLIGCKHVSASENGKHLHYIEIKVSVNATQVSSLASLHGNIAVKRPRVRCDDENIALSVSQQINYARNIYAERLQTLIVDIT